MPVAKQLKWEEFSEARKIAYAEILKEAERKGIDVPEHIIKEMKGDEIKMVEEVKVKAKAIYCKCSVCGKEKFTRPDVYKKRIEKFGSEEKLATEYKCRLCRK